MADEKTIMGWLKNLGNLVIPGEGGNKADLFAPERPRVLPPSLVKSIMTTETHEQMGGLNIDKGLIDVLTDKLEVVEFNEEMTEVTGIARKDLLEATGETGYGGVIESFIEKFRSSKTGSDGWTEIDFQGKTTDGQDYNFTLVADSRDDKGNLFEGGEPKFFLFSGGDKAELELDQFVTIANNLDEKLSSVETARVGQDRWSPASFRYAWEQTPTITVGTPYASLGNRPK